MWIRLGTIRLDLSFVICLVPFASLSSHFYGSLVAFITRSLRDRIQSGSSFVLLHKKDNLTGANASSTFLRAFICVECGERKQLVKWKSKWQKSIRFLIHSDITHVNKRRLNENDFYIQFLPLVFMSLSVMVVLSLGELLSISLSSNCERPIVNWGFEIERERSGEHRKYCERLGSRKFGYMFIKRLSFILSSRWLSKASVMPAGPDSDCFIIVGVSRPKLAALFLSVMLISLFLTFHILYDSAVYSIQVTIGASWHIDSRSKYDYCIVVFNFSS